MNDFGSNPITVEVTDGVTEARVEQLVEDAGGGAPLSNATPLASGTADPGTGTSASREDHVHPDDRTYIDAQDAATLAAARAGLPLRYTGIHIASTAVDGTATTVTRYRYNNTSQTIPVSFAVGQAVVLDSGLVYRVTSSGAWTALTFNGGDLFWSVPSHELIAGVNGTGGGVDPTTAATSWQVLGLPVATIASLLDPQASGVAYDDSDTSLSASDVQAAVVAVKALLDTITGNVDTLTTDVGTLADEIGELPPSAPQMVFPVRFVPYENIDISTFGTTMAGMTPSFLDGDVRDGDKLYVFGQTNTAENGIYTYHDGEAAVTYDDAQPTKNGSLIPFTHGGTPEQGIEFHGVYSLPDIESGQWASQPWLPNAERNFGTMVFVDGTESIPLSDSWSIYAASPYVDGTIPVDSPDGSGFKVSRRCYLIFRQEDPASREDTAAHTLTLQFNGVSDGQPTEYQVEPDGWVQIYAQYEEGLLAWRVVASSKTPYRPANPSDWDTAPTTTVDALDELASRVRALEP